MEINNKTRQIAYHSLIIKEDGLYFVQYDFDGKIIEERKLRDYNYAKDNS